MEQNDAAPTEDTPPEVDTTAPTEDTAAEDPKVVDYRSRYENLLPEFTRKSQRLAELEAQIGTQPEEDDEYEYEDEDYIDPRLLDQLIEQKTQAALDARDRQQADRDAEIAFVNAEIGTLEKEFSEEFSEEEWDYLGRTSEQLRDEAGRPDVRRAYEHFNAVIEGRKQKWVGTKKGAARPASGPGAAEVVDLDDSNSRAEFIDRIMEQHVDPD